MEMSDILIEPYLPQSVFGGTNIDAALLEADEILEQKKNAARQRGCSLMYIARFNNHTARIGVEEIAPEHPFYHLSGNDNIVSLTTRSLYHQPLVIRGSGAGAKLTASGIFNDIVNVSHSMN
jgi:aspartokinase/homoserine dehydrogenase 1